MPGAFLPTAALLREAQALLASARDAGITLRLTGGLAVRLHCSESVGWLDRRGRGHRDVDFVGISEERKQLRAFMQQHGFQVDRQILIAAEGRRYSFWNESGEWKIDVFIDNLEFCHRLAVAERLRLDYPTIPLADLLLSKLQIVEPGEPDVLDIVALLGEHELSRSSGDPELIDTRHIGEVLGRDWGFYHTVMTNLHVLEHTAGGGCHELPLREAVLRRVRRLRTMLTDTPKTVKWKLRSLIGTRVKWYKDVSREDRIF